MLLGGALLRVRYYLPEGRNEQSGELHFGTGGASTTLQADICRMDESPHSARSCHSCVKDRFLNSGRSTATMSRAGTRFQKDAEIHCFGSIYAR